MRKQQRRVVTFGDLVVAAFDRAARHSKDPRRVARLAEIMVVDLLLRSASGVVTLPRAARV